MAEQPAHQLHAWNGTKWVPVVLPGPEPTWRDVIRAMRSAGFSLEKTEGYPWESYWSIEDDESDQLGSIVRTTVLGEVEWKVSFWGGTGSWEGVTLADPSPADVLTATRLVGLIGGTS